MVKACEEANYYENGPDFLDYDQRMELRQKLIMKDQALIATIFETGGRVIEVLRLRKDNFEITEDLVTIRRMEVVKRYEKVREMVEMYPDPQPFAEPAFGAGGKWHWSITRDGWVRRRYLTEPKKVYRGTIEIPTFEPMVPYMIKAVENAEDYLFATDYNRKGGEPHISTNCAYNIIREAGERIGLLNNAEQGLKKSIFPHWFRAQRACQLAQEYGFREEELRKFFLWETPEIVYRYAKLATGVLTSMMTQEKIKI